MNPQQQEQMRRLKARVIELESAMREIRDLATYDAEELDSEEPSEDDMIDALCAIYERTEVIWSKATQPSSTESKP